MTYYTKDEFAQSATSTPSESFGWYDGAADFRFPLCFSQSFFSLLLSPLEEKKGEREKEEKQKRKVVDDGSANLY
jgi:hypothetical protein